MMNAPKSIWPFSTGLGREAKQESVRHCVKAVREGEGDKRDIKHRVERGGWSSALRKGGGRGTQEQEDTHYSAICAAEKHKDMLGNACLCVCTCFIRPWFMHQ